MKNLYFFPTFALLVCCLYVRADETPSSCEAAATCGDCLRTSGECYWCEDGDFTAKSSRRPRCNTKRKLEDSGCKSIQITDGSVSATKDDPFASKMQVKPQKVSVVLRPGQTQSFTLSVRPAENYPVRLYYLMDMSNSMEDDLVKLQTLGTKIANEIKSITEDYKLAFGTFVDKTVAPFVQLEMKDKPCSANQKCEPTFGFKHVFPFNKDATLFEKAVSSQMISGNLDTPEGGFDALMQVAVCEGTIGWDPVGFSRRIVVFVSDASPHIAGDGKLGGITVPNDGKCHLVNNSYPESNSMDYPSISQLKAKLKENKVVPIIAVTKDVLPIYQKIANQWKDLGVGIGSLETDSSNIVDLIRDNYKKISTTVRLTDDSPGNIIVKYKVENGCAKEKQTADNECTDVAIKQEVDFRVSITAVKCIDEAKKGQKFTVTVPGFGDAEVDVKLICDCDCEKGGVPDSPLCNGTGTYKCGICYCNEGRFGKKCECDSESQADTTLCKMPNSTDETICSGFGSCVCGKCECDKRTNPLEIISGTYCQCNNFGCDRYNGEICGGADRGICVCGRCVCKEAYLGDNCGQINCTLGQKNCIKDDVVCSGNGVCDCDQCECNTGYKGTYCENCVSCPGKCADNEDCVLCQAYDIGEKEVCDKCNLNIVFVNETLEQCSVESRPNCYVTFKFVQDISGNETVYVEGKERCIIVLKKDAPILIIVLGIIGGIVLLGLILLLVGKLIVTAYDNYEYHKFEKDRMKSKWENAENPIYRPSKQQFQNPAYAGNK